MDRKIVEGLEKRVAKLDGRLKRKVRSAPEEIMFSKSELLREYESAWADLNTALKEMGSAQRPNLWSFEHRKDLLKEPSIRKKMESSMVRQALISTGRTQPSEKQIEKELRREVLFESPLPLNVVSEALYSTGHEGLYRAPLLVLLTLGRAPMSMLELEDEEPRVVETTLGLYGCGEYENLQKAYQAALLLEK